MLVWLVCVEAASEWCGRTQDPRVLLKQDFMNDLRRKRPEVISGRDWYSQQASRAVNQVCGATGALDSETCLW